MKPHNYPKFKRILFFCFFLLVCISSCTKENKPVEKAETIIQQKKEPIVSVEHYPKEITKNVHQKLDSLLKRVNKRQDFHGAVLVAKNNKIVYQNQVGYADFRKKISLESKSTFQLASVSKQFTAAAIMLLKERNLLKITDTVNVFFPDFPYENVTIKNLLNHTSGLPKYFWFAEHLWNKQKPPSNSEMMQLFASSDVMRFFRPGRNFDYSNTGYLVLASIVEKVSGKSFNNFLKENFFDPFDMKNSYVFSYEKDTVHKNQLKGYRLYRGWKHIVIPNTINDAIVGDKNVYATIDDLYKWTYGLNSGKLLSKESLDLMYSRGETVYGRKVPYGFGFRIDHRNTNKIYHHGKWNGFTTGIDNYLDDDLVVIILEHTSFKGITSLNKKIKKIVLKHLDV